MLQTDALYYGDCLEVMRKWPSRCVDLIYLDPPFNSKANYNVLFGAGKTGREKNRPRATDRFHRHLAME